MNEFPELDRDDEIVCALLAPFERVRPVALPHRPAQSRRPRRSYLARRLVPVVALAAAAFAFVMIAPWQHGPASTVIQRALAAIGDEPVMHVITRSDTGFTYVDLASGREAPQLNSLEIWYDRERRFFHIKDSIDGHLVHEGLWTPAGVWQSDQPPISGDHVDRLHRGPLDPALEQFFDHYRSALKNGEARPAGSGTIDGHEVNWIELSLDGGESQYFERVAIDSGTALPIRVELSSDGKVEHGYDVVSIETMPAGEGDFTAPKGGLAKVYGESQKTPISLSEAAAALPGALSTGDSIAGLSFSSVTREDLSITYPKSSEQTPLVFTGVEIRYGAGLPRRSGAPRSEWEGGHGDFVTLQEAAAPQPLYGWSFLGVTRSGTILISPGGELVLNGLEGFLVKNGIYVHIQASSRDLLLEAARALEPIQAPASPTGN